MCDIIVGDLTKEKVVSKFVIEGRLPTLNEYILANRSNRYSANNLKKKEQQYIRACIYNAHIPRYDRKIKLKITWYEQNKKRDADNIIFAKKFILDAMVQMQVIPNDTQKYVDKFEEEIVIDKDNPRIEVEII